MLFLILYNKVYSGYLPVICELILIIVEIFGSIVKS